MSAALQVKVNEKPILFSAPMVRAILEGRKTQTRRVMKPQPELVNDSRWRGGAYLKLRGANVCVDQCREGLVREASGVGPSPYGQVGDHLWVREALRWTDWWVYDCDKTYVDPDRVPKKAKPSRSYLTPFLMPRWASRVTLEIISIRVERLQQVTWEDCIAEGIVGTPHWDAVKSDDLPDHPEISDIDESINESWRDFLRIAFQKGWDSLNAKRGYSWESNPWVWVIEFKKL